MDIEEELIKTEINLRRNQSELGVRIIWWTIIVCLGAGLLPLFSGGMSNENAPSGTTAQILLSDNFKQLIFALSIPFVIGITAGIILIKSSVKKIAESYFSAPVEEDDDCESENS